MKIQLTPELAYDGEERVTQPNGFVKILHNYHHLVTTSEVEHLTRKLSGSSLEETPGSKDAYFRTLQPSSIKFSGFFRKMFEDLPSSDDEKEDEMVCPQVVSNADRELLDIILDFFEHYASLPNSNEWKNEAIQERKNDKAYTPEDEITEWDAQRLANLHSMRIVQLIKVAEFFDSDLIRMKACKWLTTVEIKGFDVEQLKKYLGTDRTFSDEERLRVKEQTGIIWL